MRPGTGSWVNALAVWAASVPPEELPADVQRAACRATLDAVACALGALDHPSTGPVLDVVHSLGGAAEAMLIGSEARTSTPNAILYNSTLVRALDCNDIYFDYGVGGHPSDLIPVALAFAEVERRSGLAFLHAVAVGYQLYWRLRHYVLGSTAGHYTWDHVSGNGLTAAAMAGLLLGLSQERLAAAMAIAGAQVFSLSEIRAGEISMLKGAATGITAQTGALAALLARAGMTGPEELFEGSRGVLAALGREATSELLDALTGPVDRWHIHDVTVKPYPAIGTSQGAIAATLELVKAHKLGPDDVEHVDVRFADLPVTRTQITDTVRAEPRTRETADHSFPFLVAVAIEDGEVGPRQFADERWLRPATRDLMRKVSFEADATLNAHTTTGYPAVVTVHTRDGRTLRQEMLAVPGGTRNRLSDAELATKLRRFAPSSLPATHLQTLESAVMGLDQAADLSTLTRLLRRAV